MSIDFYKRDDGDTVRRRYGGARWLRALIVALRVLVGVLALHFSGIAGLASGVSLGAADDCCTDCPIEQSGNECPPACPICHCTHGNIALPAAFENSADSLAPVTRDAPYTPYEASVSSAPQLSVVYRPPRAISSSA